ncbi:MAG: HAMP domain-containing sensor histidine kinase, partial [Bacteroidota bacterium]
FLIQNNFEHSYERQLYIGNTLRSVLNEEVQKVPLEKISSSRLREIADRKLCDIEVYDLEGKLVSSSIASRTNTPSPTSIPRDILSVLQKNSKAIQVERLSKNGEGYLRSYFSIAHAVGHPIGFVTMNLFESKVGTSHDIPIILGKLLTVYVFLLLIIWSGGLFLVNLLTKPLHTLSERLKAFSIQKINHKLEWKSDDVIGTLTDEYNKMVDKVDIATRELVKNEREGAWQIMAQQIAHEINNSLTPLKLKTQYLNHLSASNHPGSLHRIGEITNDLLHQIEHLAGVAHQFQLFSKLDPPQNTSVSLQSFLEKFIEDFQEKVSHKIVWENNLTLDGDPKVSVDEVHLTTVLQNLILNAEEAIAEYDKGVIIVRVASKDANVIIEVEDNGYGLDVPFGEDIFDPVFSTTTTSTGLGLPICKRIVEFYNGTLSFKTHRTKGTCFSVTLPTV